MPDGGQRTVPVLELDGLEVRYGTVPAVRGLSLQVDAGEIVGLIGPNGAGKSTTLHAVMGLVPSTRGDVRLAGRSIRGRPPESVVARRDRARARGPADLRRPDRRGEPAARPGRAARRPRRRRRGRDLAWVHDLFPIVDEFAHRQAGTLSGGQQQQLAIARALVARPDVLLLDEPSLGLAPQLVDIVFGAFAAIRERGVTLLLVEQRAQRTVAFADRTYVIANGELRDDARPEGRRRHRPDGRRVHRMMNHVQTLIDAIGLGSVYALMAVGIGLVFGVLRLVNFAYGQLIMAAAYMLALHERLEPGAASIVAFFAVVIGLTLDDGARRLPAAPERLARDDARRHLRDQLPAPARSPLAQVPGRSADGRHALAPEPADRRRRLAARALDLARRDRRRRRRPRRARAAPQPHLARPAHARGGDRLPTARLLGVRANTVIFVRGRARRRARRGRRGHPDRPRRRTDLRTTPLNGHDHRVRRHRRRRDRPAALGDARRLCDRLRDRRARRGFLAEQPALPFTTAST